MEWSELWCGAVCKNMVVIDAFSNGRCEVPCARETRLADH